MTFTEEYPSNAPIVTFSTTGGGKTRFNPNLYADGKVCLSILGTWRGDSGELWSSVQNIQSIMVSIQVTRSKANPKLSIDCPPNTRRALSRGKAFVRS